MPSNGPLRATSVLLFTRAEVTGRHIFRTVRLDLALTGGEGRVWFDASRRSVAEASWQRQLHHLEAVGRAHYALPWAETDLRISVRGEGVTLSGASASLPLFVAWVALLGDRALPEPFFAAGVALAGSTALAAAPRGYAQGKVEVADALARKRGDAGRPRMWVPAGSDVDRSRLTAIEVREVATLVEGVAEILGIAATGEMRS
ncbi:hypothetical protein [Chondromyces apiculatus]|uniref:Lon proteolytic domain-containing protein n=1 Tax=Chondromyces apiculatus DSM 436 TaxID=1192034 RepID=A0A017TFI8_9BACT|nr:hypothetical protein [Chondromyces apiculatus]EYF07386.1 Hypothetical protein CAP_0139 [Chondromyces apiculatus DSM 436]